MAANLELMNTRTQTQPQKSTTQGSPSLMSSSPPISAFLLALTQLVWVFFIAHKDDAIRNLFSAKTIHEYSAQSLLTFLVMFYTLAVVTFGTAVPAGQFVPGIMIGSTYGRLVGMFVVSFYKKLNIEEGTYALLGAASFLGGSMRMTVSLCVIMVEITNNLKLLPLIMLVLLISKAVGDAFNEGLYEEQSRLRNIPQLESKPKYQMRKMTAKEACGKRVISFSRVVKVADLVSILRSNIHNGFPVIDHSRNGETLVIGLMLRSHLLVLLQSKVDFHKDVKVANVLLDDYCEAVVRDFLFGKAFGSPSVLWLSEILLNRNF